MNRTEQTKRVIFVNFVLSNELVLLQQVVSQLHAKVTITPTVVPLSECGKLGIGEEVVVSLHRSERGMQGSALLALASVRVRFRVAHLLLPISCVSRAGACPCSRYDRAAAIDRLM